MGCIKLHILDELYGRTELKESYNKKELTSNFCSENVRSRNLYKYCGKERDEETGLYYFGARFYAAWICRFCSVDPLQHKFPNISSFAYCNNNPIKYIDPDGREVKIIGDAKKEFFKEVKKGAKEFGISVKMDKDGVLSAKYKGKGEISEDGQKLMDAVSSRTVKVTANALSDGKAEETKYMHGGAFGGNSVFGETIDGTFISQFATAFQTVIPSELQRMDDVYEKPGQTSLHEITEAYFGAIIAMEAGVSCEETGSNAWVYGEAHARAIPQSGEVRRGVFDKDGNQLQEKDWDTKGSFIEWQARPNYSNQPVLLKDTDIK